jgi:hypothetical protein
MFNVSRDRNCIVLVFTELKDWPDIDIRKEPGWDRLIHVVLPVMYGIIEQHHRLLSAAEFTCQLPPILEYGLSLEAGHIALRSGRLRNQQSNDSWRTQQEH